MNRFNHKAANGYAIDITIRVHGSKWIDYFKTPDIKFRIQGNMGGTNGEMAPGGFAYLNDERPAGTVAHEFGHWLGFDHSPDVNSVMYPYGTTGRGFYPNDAEIKKINEVYK